MAKRVGVDKWLFIITLLLVLFGLVMVFSASAVMAKATYGSPYEFVVRQSAWALAGLLCMMVLMRVNYRHYNSPSVIFPCVAITRLAAPKRAAMSSRNGSTFHEPAQRPRSSGDCR